MAQASKRAHLRGGKRCAWALALVCACPPLFCAQAGGQQTVVPRQIYTGDSVRVSYSFESDADFFALANPDLFDADSLSQGDRLIFTFLDEEILENPSDALVQECTLAKNKQGWTFSVEMIPWQAGLIRFRAFDLEELCASGKVTSIQPDDKANSIALEPVEVASISKQLGETTLRPVISPLLLPRTRRTLRFLTVAMVVVVAAILVLCRRKIVRSFRTLIAVIAYKRNAHVSKKRLSQLLKSPLSDRAACQRWVEIMKGYLAVRFGRDFAQASVQDVSKEIFDATGGLLTGSRERAAEEVSLLFARADYIATSSRAGDDSRFASGERETFVLRTLKVIDVFEALGDEEEDVQGRGDAGDEL